MYLIHWNIIFNISGFLALIATVVHIIWNVRKHKKQKANNRKRDYYNALSKVHAIIVDLEQLNTRINLLRIRVDLLNIEEGKDTIDILNISLKQNKNTKVTIEKAYKVFQNNSDINNDTLIQIEHHTKTIRNEISQRIDLIISIENQINALVK